MKINHLLSVAIVASAILTSSCTRPAADEKPLIGVAFLIHGGFETRRDSGLWDSTLQIFSYDQNSFVYQRVIWNKAAWPMILNVGNAPKERGKYEFEFDRIGGHDPAMDYSRQQLADMTAALKAAESELGVRFITDYVNWIGNIPHLPQPRNIYQPGTPDGNVVNFCGATADNPDGWANCDPERYNTDGTIERMLAAGAEEIIVIDLTTSGVRFFKSNDVIRLSREVIAAHNAANGTDVRLRWLNDPADLMRDSYPDKPAGWTNALGAPEHDPRIALDDRPNPVSSDAEFARLHAEGILSQLNTGIDPASTGVLLINHATRQHNQLFDPKIDDTLILNANIEEQLLALSPRLQPDNIVGAWMGIKETNPQVEPRPPAFSNLERTRRMRGENLGHAYLYESDEIMPSGKWGYLYWDALEQLKNQGVSHIVVAFPQISVDSVLNLVELPNQIGKEIGYKNWLQFYALDYATYPDVGHPFADYWGIWVSKECPAGSEQDKTVPCCFEMGGCADGRPYPPARITAANKARNDLDPSLAYDVSEYGHLGYDPTQGSPDKNKPVQQQYTGTWATWSPPNTDPRVGQFLAKHVIDYLQLRATSSRQ
jgi:hypothetical protein